MLYNVKVLPKIVPLKLAVKYFTLEMISKNVDNLSQNEKLEKYWLVKASIQTFSTMEYL